MAKYETELRGNLNTIVSDVDNCICSGISATREEESDYTIGGTRIVIKAYERYSMMGGNRVSLTITYAESDGRIRVTAIATGGSQAVLFKINTFGEEAFLDKIINVLAKYIVTR